MSPNCPHAPASQSAPSSPEPLATTDPPCPNCFSFSRMSCKGHGHLHCFFCLASFAQCNAFEIHPGHLCFSRSLLFTAERVSVCGCASVRAHFPLCCVVSEEAGAGVRTVTTPDSSEAFPYPWYHWEPRGERSPYESPALPSPGNRTANLTQQKEELPRRATETKWATRPSTHRPHAEKQQRKQKA